jgi:hypothetical protein
MLHRPAGRYDNPVPTLFLAPIVKLPTLFAKVFQFYRPFIYRILSKMEFKATGYAPFESLDAEGGVGIDAGRLGPGEGAALLPLLAVTQGPDQGRVEPHLAPHRVKDR